MLYSKNGSIPQSQTDGSDGWIEVPDAPVAPEGKEVVWWYPPGWVIRDPKPETRNGYVWSWNQTDEKWVEYQIVALTTEQVVALTTEQVVALTTEQISSLGQ